MYASACKFQATPISDVLSRFFSNIRKLIIEVKFYVEIMFDWIVYGSKVNNSNLMRICKKSIHNMLNLYFTFVVDKQYNFKKNGKWVQAIDKIGHQKFMWIFEITRERTDFKIALE